MAQTDFNFYGGSRYEMAVPGLDGRSQLHSSLSSPISVGPGVGLFARQVRCDNTTFSSEWRALLKNSAPTNSFVNLTNANAISMRCWLRHGTGATGGGWSVGIVAKGCLNNATDQGRVGYILSLGTSNPAYTNPDNTNVLSSALRLSSHSGTSASQGVVTTIKATSVNTWYRVRMDIIPLVTGVDLIRVYEATVDPITEVETWTQLSERPMSTSTGDLCPWGAWAAGPQSHGITHIGNKSNGFSDEGFFDGFDIRIKDGGPFPATL